MSKKSRIKSQQKKKATKKVANLTRRQAQMGLELAAAREQLNRNIPMMDQLVNDTRQLARHVLMMESRLVNTVAHLDTGAAISTPIMTRDEYILAIKEELRKIMMFKANTLNPLMRKMGNTCELTDATERLMGEAEMQVSLMEALGALRAMGEDVQENIGKLKLQESLDFKNTVPEVAERVEDVAPIETSNDEDTEAQVATPDTMCSDDQVIENHIQTQVG